MSWQADIKRLHEKSSSLGVDLTEFEDELRNDEGWYTESNIQEFIECQNLQIAKQQEKITELVNAIKLVYIANNTSKITGFNDLMAIVEKQNNGIFMSELSINNKFSDIFGGGELHFEVIEGDAFITNANNNSLYYAKDYEDQIEEVFNSHDAMVEQLAEYKAFMLGLELSSEDEARLLGLLKKHNKGE